MAALLLKVSCNEQRSVICFRWAKEHSANAIQSEMRPVYGNECFTRPAIHVRCKKVAHSQENIVDREEPVIVLMTDATIAAVDFLVQSDGINV